MPHITRTALSIRALLLSGGVFCAVVGLTCLPGVTYAQAPVSGDALSQDTPALNYLRHDVHARMTSLGEIAGPGHECFAFDVNGKKNTGCLLPDGEHFMIGIVVDSRGHNVTVDALAHEEARLANAMKQAGVLAEQSRQAGDLGSSLPSIADGGGARAPMPSDQDDVSAVRLPGAISADEAKGAQSSSSALPPGEDPRWFANGLKPSELSEDFTRTASFVVGNKRAPQVILVADPNCPFCHRAWEQIRPYVSSGRISVAIILVSEQELHSEDNVVRLLSNPAIDKAWMAGQGAQDGVPVEAHRAYNSHDWIEAKKLIPYNNAFLDKYAPRYGSADKNGAPLLFYVGKSSTGDNRRVYVREGVSNQEDMDSFLGGI